jgi:hypothetical protein
LGQKPDSYLGSKEAAARIGQTPQWLMRARQTPGKGPPGYKIGKKYLYRPEELAEWMERRRVG